MRPPSRSRPSSLCRFTPLAAALAGALAQQAFGACTPVPPPSPNPVYCVTNADPSGVGSLAQAFADASNEASCANTSPTIAFAIPPGKGPFTISPSLSLNINCLSSGSINATLDGTSQTGYVPNTSSTGFNAQNQIIVSGAAMTSSSGISVQNFGYGASLTIRGIDFTDFTYGGSATAIDGPVNLYGSRVQNSYNGVNTRGYDPDGFLGAAPLQAAKIGGSTDAERNVFTGNTNASIIVCCENGTVDITNNFIGTPDGSTAGGGGKGIHLTTAGNVAIIGNLISGNNAAGIVMSAFGATVRDNKIGTKSDGTTALGNAGAGIHSDFSNDVDIINNTIAFNGADGIVLPSGNSHVFTGNRIFSNGVKAINLGMVPTQVLNDIDDGDSGPNDLQNFPVISSVIKDPVANTTTINWSLNSTTGTGFGIEFFSNPAASATPQARSFLDPSVLGFGAPGGNTGLGTTIFDATVIPGLHDFITATATDQSLGQTSELGSMALARGLDMTPATLDFGNVVVNSSSGSLTSSLTSLGADTVTLSYVGDSSLCYGGNPPCTSGPFACSTTCSPSTPYAAGPACSVTATFTPIIFGVQSTQVHICDNAGGNPRTLTLTGTGVPPPPVGLTPTSHNFGSVSVGGNSAIKTFSLSNPAPTPIPVGTFAVAGPFTLLGSTCTSSLPPASSCDTDVKFSPVAAGAATGTLQVTAGGTVLSSTLSGNGTLVPALVISPPSYDFGTVLVGQSSAPRAFSIQNTAATATPLSSVSVTSGFQIASSDCGVTLGPATRCVANVRFTPDATGLTTGALTATGSGGTTSAGLSGNGVQQPAASIPSDLIEFGALMLDGDPVTRVVTLRNTGNAILAINSIAVALPFTLEHDCPASLGAGGACQIRITFQPRLVGDYPRLLTLSTNAPGGTSIQIRVHAAVQPRPEPVIRVSPRSIGFGDRFLGTESSPRRVTVTNEGGANANGLEVLVNSPHFLIQNTTCGNVLAAQSSCFADVVFQPFGSGPKHSTLSVVSNAPTATTALSGAGCRPARPRSLPNCAP